MNEHKHCIVVIMCTVYIHNLTLILAIFIHRINKLRTLLQTNLNKHINTIQTLQRDLRQKTEFRLEALRDSNVQIMRSFKYVIDILCNSVVFHSEVIYQIIIYLSLMYFHKIIFRGWEFYTSRNWSISFTSGKNGQAHWFCRMGHNTGHGRKRNKVSGAGRE